MDIIIMHNHEKYRKLRTRKKYLFYIVTFSKCKILIIRFVCVWLCAFKCCIQRIWFVYNCEQLQQIHTNAHAHARTGIRSHTMNAPECGHIQS